MRTFEQWAESAGYQPLYLRRDTGEFRDGIQDVFEAYSAGVNEAANEIERLRAEIDAMKQQEFVAEIVQNSSGQIRLIDRDKGAFDVWKHVGKRLYLAAGAQGEKE